MFPVCKELTAPAAEPLTLDKAKKHLVVDSDFTDDDDTIKDLIIAAREYLEGPDCLNRAIYERSMACYLDFFPYWHEGTTVNPNDRHCMNGRYWHQAAILLPFPKVVAVGSVSYVDLNGDTQTVDAARYTADMESEPARLVPKSDYYWPYAQNYDPNSITVKYTSGTWGDGVEVDKCPASIRQAMRLLIGHWYNHRDATEYTVPHEIELGVKALCGRYAFDSFRC